MHEDAERQLQQLTAGLDNHLSTNILVRFRPAPQLVPGSLPVEQAYTISPQEPYRIRVLRTWICPERGLVILNCKIRDDHRLGGAMDDPGGFLKFEKSASFCSRVHLPCFSS